MKKKSMNAWRMMSVILNNELNENHLIITDYLVTEEVLSFLKNRDWNSLDNYFLKAEKKTGELYSFLSKYLEFQKIEHIIAIRSSMTELDEDGIWHDDGSRILGFSLSLTLNPEVVEGGELRFRAKSSVTYSSIKTQALGKIILFKTGIYGFEHMVSAVKSGERIVIAGWCS